jgi:hypothetical protein
MPADEGHDSVGDAELGDQAPALVSGFLQASLGAGLLADFADAVAVGGRVLPMVGYSSRGRSGEEGRYQGGELGDDRDDDDRVIEYHDSPREWGDRRRDALDSGGRGNVPVP